MKSDIEKLTIRVTPQQNKELKKRAAAANLSVNQFVIRSALTTPPHNEKALSELMGALCSLDVLIKRCDTLEDLRSETLAWRRRTIALIGGLAEWHN